LFAYQSKGGSAFSSSLSSIFSHHSRSSEALGPLLQGADASNNMVELAAIAVHLFAILCISVSAEIELPGNLYQAHMPHRLLLSATPKTFIKKHKIELNVASELPNHPQQASTHVVLPCNHLSLVRKFPVMHLIICRFRELRIYGGLRLEKTNRLF
uniref:Uncharacterized protein n=1 Tax=Parascaris equorum TaxID=6256 RepID=A0A914RWY7_PAREQ